MSAPVPAVCTICTNPELPAARALMESVRRFHPEAERFVFLADTRLPDPELYDGPFELLPMSGLPVLNIRNLAFGCSAGELRAALRPYAAEHLLLDRGFERLLCIDPVSLLFAPCHAAAGALGDGASMLLVPRLHGPPADEAAGADFAAMREGAFAPGFVGLARCTEAVDVLGWWKARVQRHWSDPAGRSMFLSGRVLDLVPGFARGARVLHDKGAYRGAWGLSPEDVEGDAEGGWRVDGCPLACFGFDGFDPARPGRLGALAPASGTALAGLLAAYAAGLPAAVPAALDGQARFASGVAIAPVLRRMFREQVPDWVGDPFAGFEAFLHEPAPAGSRDRAGLMLTRLMQFLWEGEPALRELCDPETPEGLAALTDWFVRDARREHGLDWRLIEPVAERLGRRAPVAVVDGNGGGGGISVVGYLRTASGTGTVARHTLAGLAASGRAVDGLDVALNVLGDRGVTEAEGTLRDRAEGAVQIFANVNADQLPQVLRHLAPRLREPAYRIAMPAWELEEFPDAWLPAFDGVDEVWAQTPWIQRMLAPKLDKPVIHMPVVLTLEPPAVLPRERFGLPEDAFLFFFAFDFLSFVARKNPGAAVRAFQRLRATATGGRAGLVVKTMNGAHAPEAHAAFLELVAGIPGIHLVDQVLTRDETLGLTAACDCVLSLHRCEGLGLVVAEAMALGVPVIATDYSATADLLGPETGFPVDHHLVPVPPGSYPMGEGQVWAEPDVGHAAWLMGFVMRHPEEAARRAEAARRRLAERHGREAVVARQLARLDEIAAAGDW